MIQGITPQIIADISKNLSPSQKPLVSLPAENSLVDFKILDKISNTYKILVKGFVFQTKLPLNLITGDEIIGKVISRNPFTILLNNLAGSKNFNQIFISEIISKLNLEDTGLIKKLVEEIIKSDKPLVKSKINQLAEYYEKWGLSGDELAVNLMINIMWSEKNGWAEQNGSNFNLIFDISFSDLVKKITYQLEQIYFTEQDLRLNEILVSALIMDIFEQNAKINQLLIRNREEAVLEILDYLRIKVLNSSGSRIYAELSKDFSKYIVQKSMYNRFGLSRDFVILREGNKLISLVFTSEIVKSTNSMINKITGSHEDKNFIVNLSDNKIVGSISFPSQNDVFLYENLQLLNQSLSQYFNLPVNIILSQSHSNLLGSVGSINVKA